MFEKSAKRKICIKKANTFTIIAMNFVQEKIKKFNRRSKESMICLLILIKRNLGNIK